MSFTPPITNCETAPIHYPSSIQPAGFIVVLDKRYQIKNFAGELFFKAKIGDALQDVCPKLFNILSAMTVTPKKTLLSYANKNEYYELALHAIDNLYILEGVVKSACDLDIRFKDNFIINALKATDYQNENLFQSIADYIYELLNFDRVMLYRFDKDMNGEVISEAKNDVLHSFLNHHFPAGDIPLPARELYFKNPIRVVFCASKNSIPFFERTNIDMSYSYLRGVADVHREYLQNMSIETSVSLSIIINDKLWGLVACHNSNVKTVSFKEIETLEALSSVFSRAIHSRENEDALKQTIVKKEVIDAICANAEYDIASHGLIYGLNGACEPIGYVLDSNAIMVISLVDGAPKLMLHTMEKINEECVFKLYNGIRNKNFPVIVDNANSIDCKKLREMGFAGFAAIKVDKKRDCIMFILRTAEEKTIKWAGNPAKNDTNGVLTPRESFETWKEIVKDKPKPYLEIDKLILIELEDKLSKTIGFSLDIINLNNHKTMLAVQSEQDKSKEYLWLVEVMIIALDNSGVVKLANRKACEILECEEHEIIGANWFLDFLSPSDASGVISISKKIMSGNIKKVEYYENYVLSKSGKKKLIAWHNTSLKNDKNEIIGILTSGEDITQKALIQNKLKELNLKLKSANEKLKSMATIDSLTKLYNRRHFDSIVHAYYKNAKRNKQYVTFLMFDIDNFKKYNDEYGHMSGDNVLKKIAKSFQTTLKRTSDAIFRIGGEEFCAIISVQNKNDVFALAENIRRNVENLNIAHSQNKPFNVITISVGAVVTDLSAEYKSEFYKIADDALYSSKKDGRNKISAVIL